MHLVFETVRREAERYGVPVVGSEIVGLIPKKAIEDVGRVFPALRKLPAGTGIGKSHCGGRRIAQRTTGISGRAGRSNRDTRRRKRQCGSRGDGRRTRSDGNAAGECRTPSRSNRTARYFTEAVDRDAEAFQKVMGGLQASERRARTLCRGGSPRRHTGTPGKRWNEPMRCRRAWNALQIPARYGSDLAVAKALTIAAKTGVLGECEDQYRLPSATRHLKPRSPLVWPRSGL